MSEDSINGLLCLKCGAILVSWWVHDYKMCGCSNQAMIDGGRDYLRYGAAKWEDVQLLKIAKFAEEAKNGATWEEISERVTAPREGVGESAGQLEKNRSLPEAGK